jgi:hypothetical protein
MTLDQLDQLLAEWKNRMDAASQNLVELHSLPSYEMLTGADGASKLRLVGATEKRIAPAVAALNELMRDYETLATKVALAEDLRKAMPRFSGVDQKIREIEALLLGPCVPIPDSPMAYADRDLVMRGGGQGRYMTLPQLLQRMNEVFLTGRTGLVELDGHWKMLESKLSPVNAFLSANRSETAAGVPDLRDKVDAVRAKVMADPIGANSQFDREIAPIFPRVKADAEKLVQQRAGLRQDLARGRDLLKRLAELRTENEQTYAECREKIAGGIAPAPPFPAQRIAEFTDWLTRLEQKSAEGLVDAVCVGLEKCLDGIRELTAREESALARNRSPLDLRRELRGRLSALKAKALSRGVSEDPALVEIGERANGLLYARPTPLEEASGLVSQYEARVNGRSPRPK